MRKFLLFIILLGFTACSSSENIEYKYPEKVKGKYTRNAPADEDRETIFGKGGLTNIFSEKESSGGGGIGVNSFLWRSTLDTISFMPIASADPFGGVIITDWYAPPQTPAERFKLNIFITSKALRADGVKVTSFKQTKDNKGNWVDSAADEQVSQKIEETILTKARELNIAERAQKK
jgi:hypothetical protein